MKLKLGIEQSGCKMDIYIYIKPKLVYIWC